MSYYRTIKWSQKARTVSCRPLGIILCTGKTHEQIELLELDKSGIHVAEYITTLPSKAELQKKLHQSIEFDLQRFENKD